MTSNELKAGWTLFYVVQNVRQNMIVDTIYVTLMYCREDEKISGAIMMDVMT